eukprot:scaffold659_cov329-Prasinococcus_capsulatus_cf.AAC.37
MACTSRQRSTCVPFRLSSMQYSDRTGSLRCANAIRAPHTGAAIVAPAGRNHGGQDDRFSSCRESLRRVVPCGTPSRPETRFLMSMSALSSLPAHSTHASCGVYPANHTSLLSLDVPVLPAAGRPNCAPTPVPRSTAAYNTANSVAVSLRRTLPRDRTCNAKESRPTTSCSSTRVRSGMCSYTSSPARLKRRLGLSSCNSTPLVREDARAVLAYPGCP